MLVWTQVPVFAQLPSLDHLRSDGKLNHPIIQCMHGFGTDELCPTEKGGVVRDVFKVDATEPAQHQAIIDPVLCLSSNSSGTGVYQ